MRPASTWRVDRGRDGDGVVSDLGEYGKLLLEAASYQKRAEAAEARVKDLDSVTLRLANYVDTLEARVKELEVEYKQLADSDRTNHDAAEAHRRRANKLEEKVQRALSALDCYELQQARDILESL